MGSAQNQPQPGGIWKLPRVIQESGLGRSTIYARVKEGTFPAPLKLGKNASGWLAAEVIQWRNALPRITEIQEQVIQE